MGCFRRGIRVLAGDVGKMTFWAFLGFFWLFRVCISG